MAKKISKVSQVAGLEMSAADPSIAPRNALSRPAASLCLAVRPGQSVALTFAIGYKPSLEKDAAAEKGAILSASWADADGKNIPDIRSSGWSKSELYGLFQYVACPNDREMAHYEFMIMVPRGAAFVEFSVRRFANWTISVNQMMIRRS